MNQDPKRIRAVFDCMVFLQGAGREHSPAGGCLRLAEAGVIELVVSPEILAEIRDVLQRPALRERFPALTVELVNRFLLAVTSWSTLIVDISVRFPYPRDPKDEPYINLALAADVDYLVSRDSDLLALGDPGRPEGREFIQSFPA